MRQSIGRASPISMANRLARPTAFKNDGRLRDYDTHCCSKFCCHAIHKHFIRQIVLLLPLVISSAHSSRPGKSYQEYLFYPTRNSTFRTNSKNLSNNLSHRQDPCFLMMIIGLDDRHLSDFDPKKNLIFFTANSGVVSGQRTMYCLDAHCRLRIDNKRGQKHANFVQA